MSNELQNNNPKAFKVMAGAIGVNEAEFYEKVNKKSAIANNLSDFCMKIEAMYGVSLSQ